MGLFTNENKLVMTSNGYYITFLSSPFLQTPLNYTCCNFNCFIFKFHTTIKNVSDSYTYLVWIVLNIKIQRLKLLRITGRLERILLLTRVKDKH